ncbi:MAG: ribulose-phosphate 3-epimerase [Alphaproteobacteria bacterium]|nr:ribulose-phosphate 3-epimerase [Alphaproteobacteria bacterium]
MIKIAPSILASNFLCLKDEIISVEKAGADLIHFDVMDGHFVDNITFGPMILAQAKNCVNIDFDVHLMVQNPSKFIPWYAKAGADIITFHLEASNNPMTEINLIKSFGLKVGISVKPQTDVNELLPYIDYIDLILIMSVNPGFGGQSFNTDTLNRISKVKEMIKNNNIFIEVDGGINKENAKLCIEKGADILVAGTTIFKSENYKKIIDELKGV